MYRARIAADAGDGTPSSICAPRAAPSARPASVRWIEVAVGVQERAPSTPSCVMTGSAGRLFGAHELEGQRSCCPAGLALQFLHPLRDEARRRLHRRQPTSTPVSSVTGRRGHAVHHQPGRDRRRNCPTRPGSGMSTAGQLARSSRTLTHRSWTRWYRCWAADASAIITTRARSERHGRPAPANRESAGLGSSEPAIECLLA